MQYYDKVDDKLVCLLCQHYCTLKDNQIGICGVNQNTGSKIENLVYGYPTALNIDPIEKKPLYHFFPTSKSFSIGTVGCNFKCSFCQNWQISQEKKINKKTYYSPKNIVQLALKHNCKSISYTYNEPTIFYPYAKDIAIEAKKYGLKNVYVSNGFESTEVINDMKGIIDAVNIDLKSFNKAYYKKYLGGDLDKLLENLKLFKKNNIWIEITTLIVPTHNDSSEELKQIANFIYRELGSETPWHISAFRPQYKELTLPRTSMDMLLNAYNIGKEVGLDYIYIGNVGYKNITKCTSCKEVLINREYFNVLGNKIINGKCPKCEQPVEGIFC